MAFKESYKYYEKFKKQLYTWWAVALMGGILLILRPFALKIVIDALDYYNLKDLLFPLMFFVLAQFFPNYLFILGETKAYKLFAKSYSEFFNTNLEFLTKKKQSFYAKNSAGAIISDLNAIERITVFLLEVSQNFIRNILRLIAAVILLIYLNSSLGLIIFGAMFVVTVVNYFLYKRLEVLSVKNEQTRSDFDSKVFDMVSNISVLRVFNAFSSHKKYMAKHLEEYSVNSEKAWVFRSYLDIFASVSISSIKVFFLFSAIKLYQASKMSVADILVFQTLISYIGYMLFNISSFIQTYDKAYSPCLIANKRLQDGSPLEGFSKKINSKNIQKTPVLEIKDLEYKIKNKTILKNINLKIPKKANLGIVGASGSGKTSLVKVLTALVKATNGKILIDNIDSNTFKNFEIRKLFAKVPQDTSLFNRSLRANLDLNQNATDKEIIAVIKKAQLFDFYKDLKDGLDTKVGERGVKLSGGQRQRVAIARAMLNPAPIVILDEASSALDSKNEKAVQKAISNLCKDKTLIAIAHRLSTLKEMDEIIVLDKGEIQAQGTHEQLIKSEGTYKDFWTHQTQSFI